MPNKIQPEYEVGPNNAGKMILRGCLMNVSRTWLEQTSGQVGSVLSRYLSNRNGEATEIKLNYGENIPEGRENGPHKLDIEFMASVVFRLRSLEKRGNKLQQASADDIFDQVGDQVLVLRQQIEDYKTKCEGIGIEPMFTGIPNVIIDNVLSRNAITHAASMQWETSGDLFEGLTVNDPNSSKKGYEPPSLS